ncbi:UPF0149 family protein [Chitinophaga pollutisoli]|uniref:UPF0149 family protein n=1 Tax=Chitinophaga pollutisoli TaxID=3133966 RepID=A0ABZ2YWP6_9BACT
MKGQGAMNPEMIDGFFTAMNCGPETVLPSEYMLVIFGEANFDSQQQAEVVLRTLIRHWNVIVSMLSEDMAFLAFFQEHADGVVYGNDWAKGFLMGMGIRHKNVPDPALRTSSAPKSAADREELLDAIESAVPAIYQYFEPHRQAYAENIIRRAAIIGPGKVKMLLANAGVVKSINIVAVQNN